MQRILIAPLLALATLAAPKAEATILRFDMGTEQSELRSGFSRVTPATLYRKDLGYGWRSPEGLKAHYQHYADWQYSESRGVKQPPPIYTNEITCDSIHSQRENAFLVDLPPGQYTVYVLWAQRRPRAGLLRVRRLGGVGSPHREDPRSLDLRAAAAHRLGEKRPAGDRVCPQNRMGRGGDSDRTGRRPRALAEILRPLEQEIYFLPPTWPRSGRKPSTSTTASRPSGARRTSGGATRSSPGTGPRSSIPTRCRGQRSSIPNSRPSPRWANTSRSRSPCCRCRTCAGRRVTRRRPAVSGRTIPAANVDVRSVRYMRVRPNYSMFYSYHVAPDVLEHRESVDIAPGQNQRFWITVHVPEDAAAGVYEGKLTFEPAEGPAAEVPLRIRVLPIRLRKNPEHIYGMYYHDPLEPRRPKQQRRGQRLLPAQGRVGAARHGRARHELAHLGGQRPRRDDARADWTMDGEETERRIALDRKYGLADRPLVVSFPVESWYSRLVDKRGLGSHLRLVRPDVPAVVLRRGDADGRGDRAGGQATRTGPSSSTTRSTSRARRRIRSGSWSAC